MSIKKELQQIIKDSLDKSNIEIPIEEIVIETPKDTTNGDYSTNIALLLTKKLQKNPMEIATSIVDNIDSKIIEKIDIAKPGFINIYLTKERMQQEINKIIKEEKNYGKSTIGNNKKVNIEYVSANPTGILHIGHGRGATYGDNLSRIMSFLDGPMRAPCRRLNVRFRNSTLLFSLRRQCPSRRFFSTT